MLHNGMQRACLIEANSLQPIQADETIIKATILDDIVVERWPIRVLRVSSRETNFSRIPGKFKLNAVYRQAPMHKEPATWSKRDRVAYYRIDAARFRQMAEAEMRSAIVRAQLAALACRYRRLADDLENTAAAA